MAVRSRNNNLFIDFYCYLPDGRKIRCRESTRLKDNRKNRKIVESKDKAISYEIKYGNFDYLHFFPNGSKAKFFKRTSIPYIFSEWWDKWLSEKSPRLNTEKGYDSTYRVHIGPAFGYYQLTDINEHELLVFRKILEAKRLKASTINDRIMKPLCMCLLHAYKRGVIPTYPYDNIRRLTEEIPDIDPFSFEELKLFLDKIKVKRPEYYDMFFIWSRTGLRPGELYGLKWKNIDYFNRKLLVRETRLSSGKEGPPKTKHSVRDADLRPAVIESFKRQEARTLLQDNYVFLSQANKPFSDAFMRKKFRFLLKIAGMKYRPPKQMRHTFATLHIAAGENISWVSKMLGHASVEVTLKKYNRFVPNLTREDGSAFEKIMDNESEIRHIQGTQHSK